MKIPHGGVAFFDSGIGGLTVLAACRKQLPNEIFYYYGDNARAPYGNLPEEVIFSYVEEAFAHFCRLEAKAVVLACNTATAVCVEGLRRKYSVPIIGAEPALFPAAQCGGEVLVLCTCATGNSARFLRLQANALARFPDVRFLCIGCAELAGEIERHATEKEYSYARFLPPAHPSAVVLGCTHYAYIKHQIERFYQCPVFDGNEGIAKRLRWVLSTPEKPKFENGRPLLTTDFSSRIFYLGSQKTQNQRVFEQMFGK